MKVVLAGPYPVGTFFRLQKALEGTNIELVEASTEEVFDTVNDVDAVILRVLKMPKSVIERFTSRLKMIMRWGAGFDSVDIETAGKKGIAVCSTPGANAYAVSELTVLLMLAVGRKLICHDRSLHEGVWSKNAFLNQSFTLNEKIVGIIGGGNIGRQVAQKVQPFGAKVQYYDEFRLSSEVEQKYQMKYVDLDQLLRTSDIVTLHIPLLDSTKHMLDAKHLSIMKDGAILINASRGGIVDDRALLDAVNSGKLGGAGLDCVEREPLDKDDPLLANSNIIVTPHVGGGVADITDAIIPMLIENIKLLAAGGSLNYVVNRKFLDNGKKRWKYDAESLEVNS